MRVTIIAPGHELRRAVEVFIDATYARSYGARVQKFPRTLLAQISDDKSVLSAAGWRLADEFFSECYLDAPVETLLGALTHRPVSREKVFEVTSLASRVPHSVGSFLRKIVACGEAAGFEWAFFTATEPLRSLLQRLDMALVPLGKAERSRVAHPEDWGTYYEFAPNVFAVHRDFVGACLGKPARMAAHA